MTDRERAEFAKALLDNPAVRAATAEMRQQALENLAVVAPSDSLQIMRLQAQAEAAENFMDTLKSFLIATGAQDGGVSM